MRRVSLEAPVYATFDGRSPSMLSATRFFKPSVLGSVSLVLGFFYINNKRHKNDQKVKPTQW